ncbi:MAG: hypothetical protein ACK49R_14480 [Planctomycetota bacterium]
MSNDFASDPLDEDDDFGDFGDLTPNTGTPEDLADDVLAEFEEDDFDEEFDDDLEEEIEGEYALEDDKYGAEFHEEFGHLEEGYRDEFNEGEDVDFEGEAS